MSTSATRSPFWPSPTQQSSDGITAAKSAQFDTSRLGQACISDSDCASEASGLICAPLHSAAPEFRACTVDCGFWSSDPDQDLLASPSFIGAARLSRAPEGLQFEEDLWSECEVAGSGRDAISRVMFWRNTFCWRLNEQLRGDLTDLGIDGALARYAAATFLFTGSYNFELLNDTSAQAIAGWFNSVNPISWNVTCGGRCTADWDHSGSSVCGVTGETGPIDFIPGEVHGRQFGLNDVFQFVALAGRDLRRSPQIPMLDTQFPVLPKPRQIALWLPITNNFLALVNFYGPALQSTGVFGLDWTQAGQSKRRALRLSADTSVLLTTAESSNGSAAAFTSLWGASLGTKPSTLPWGGKLAFAFRIAEPTPLGATRLFTTDVVGVNVVRSGQVADVSACIYSESGESCSNTISIPVDAASTTPSVLTGWNTLYLECSAFEDSQSCPAASAACTLRVFLETDGSAHCSNFCVDGPLPTGTSHVTLGSFGSTSSTVGHLDDILLVSQPLVVPPGLAVRLAPDCPKVQ